MNTAAQEKISLHGVLSRSPRPAPPGVFAAVVTLAWRVMLKIKHVPFQLFDVLVWPIMMTFMFTYLFGGALAGSTDAYVQFLIPGILVQTLVFLTVYTGFGLSNDVSKGLFDRFKSLPMWQPSPVVGALLGDQVRYVVAAILTVVVGLIIGFRPEGGLVGVIAALALVLIFTAALSWMWIIIGLLVRTPESVMMMSMLLLMPLTFVSNTFVDPATMPSFMQAVVGINPVTHLVNATRGLMHGSFPAGDIAWVLIASAIITAIFAPIAMKVYYRER